MDPMPGEKLDYEEEELWGPQKMQYYGGGAISALAEDGLIGEDDEYDDLYNDLNVGEGFLQLQLSEAPGPYANGAVNGGFQTPKTIVPEPRPVNLVSKELNIHGVPLIGDDDEYDDLYSVGDGFLQLQLSEVPGPYANGAVNGGFQTPKTIVPEPRPVNLVPKELNVHGVTIDEKYTNSGVSLPDPKDQIAADMVSNFEAINTSQKAIAPDVSHDAQALNLGFRGSTPVAQNNGIDPFDMLDKVVNKSVSLLNPKTSVQQAVSQMPPNHSNDNVNVNRQFADDNPIRPTGDDGATMLFVGELHWWTTDAEIESVSSKYGRVKEVKFFDVKANGKSKGCCRLEFYDSAAASACNEGMNGYKFNGRACTVAFASPHTIRQMGDSYMNKSQVQPQSQSQPQERRPLNDNAGRSGGTNYPTGDSGRDYGRGGWARGQGGGNRGGGHMRGIGASMTSYNMPNAPGVGAGANSGGYGEGMGGPAFGGTLGGFMHPQGMVGAGFDPTYMGRGFPGPAFPGMMPPFRMEISGVSPPVNPAFFGRGMAANGMGIMGNARINGPHSGMSNDTNTNGCGPEEHRQTTRESSFGGEDGGSEYKYGYSSHDKGPKSNAVSRGKERGSKRDWSGNSDKRHRDESDHDREMYDREHRYREHRYRQHRYKEEKDDYRKHRQKDRYLAYKDDWDRGQTSARSRSRSRVMEEDHRSRSRDADYGKRRRLPSH